MLLSAITTLLHQKYLTNYFVTKKGSVEKPHNVSYAVLACN